MIRAVIKAVNKRIPVIAGTGSNSTDEAVRLTREAEKSGADGALMISPYYNRPTQEGIYQHYRRVASEVGIPIIVYNIPGRTGSKIEPETLARLAEIKNIAGVKEATGSVDQAIDVIRLCGDRLAVYSGEDSLIFSLMALGGKGVISTVANVAPKDTAQLTESCLAGNWQRGRELQFKLMPLIRSVFIETNPIPVKTALSLMGKCTGELRLPLGMVRPIVQGQAALLVPLARFRVAAQGQEPRCFTLVVGQPSPRGNAIQPVRLDHGPRIYDGLAGHAF